MKRIITFIITTIFSFNATIAPVMATSPSSILADEKKTAILTECEDEEAGNGEGIECVLRLVVNIMSIGIGILGIIGISVVGIQYMTAGGNEEKTRRAKTRMTEILIGLALYAALYAGLYFLLPGFKGV